MREYNGSQREGIKESLKTMTNDVVDEFDEYHKGYDGGLQRTLLGIAKNSATN